MSTVDTRKTKSYVRRNLRRQRKAKCWLNKLFIKEGRRQYASLPIRHCRKKLYKFFDDKV